MSSAHERTEAATPWPATKLGRWSGTELGQHRGDIPDDGDQHFWEEEEFIPLKQSADRVRLALAREIDRCLSTRGIASRESELRAEHELAAFSAAQDIIKDALGIPVDPVASED